MKKLFVITLLFLLLVSGVCFGKNVESNSKTITMEIGDYFIVGKAGLISEEKYIVFRGVIAESFVFAYQCFSGYGYGDLVYYFPQIDNYFNMNCWGKIVQITKLNFGTNPTFIKIKYTILN